MAQLEEKSDLKINKRYYILPILIPALLITVCFLFESTFISAYTMIIADDMKIPRSVFSGLIIANGLVSFGLNMILPKLIQRYRLKSLIVIGLFASVGMLSLFSISQNPWMLYLAGALGGMGAAFQGVVPASMIVRNWFHKHQGTLLALVMSSSGIFGIILSPVVSWGVNSYGWRLIFRVLAIVTVIILIITVLFLKTSPEEMNLHAYGQEALPDEELEKTEENHPAQPSQRGNLALLLSISILFSLGGMCIFTNVSSVLTDIGFSTLFATGIAVSCNSLANCAGKLGMGRLSDKIGCGKMLMIWYGIVPFTVLYFLMVRFTFFPVGIIGSFLAGLIGGIYSVPIPIVAGRIFDSQYSYARAVSYCTGASALFSTFSNSIFHGFFDISGTYIFSLTYIFVLSLICFILVFIIIRRNREQFKS